MNRLLCLFVCLSMAMFAFSQNSGDINILVQPSLSPDGSQLAFSHQGDVWTVSANGGRATRLTIHEGYESYPSWSPDGSHIAFNSARNGGYDVYTITSDGRDLKQLTHHSARDNRPTWHGNDSILFSTSRNYVQLEWEDEIHAVAANGGTPVRRLSALGEMAVASPDGRYIAFVRGGCRIEREAYRGPANRNVWIFDTKTKTYTAITTDEGQDISPDWGDANTLYFLSAQSGRYNIHKVTIENGKLVGKAQAMTDYTDEGIRNFDVSGSRMMVSKGTDVMVGGLDKASLKAINVNLGGDYRFDPIEKKTERSGASDYALSPDEKQIAFILRGELFVTKNDKEDDRTTRLTDHPYHDKNPLWVNDSIVLFLSDRGGNYDLYVLQSADPETPNLFKSLRHEIRQITQTPEDEFDIRMSPDHTKIVYRQGRGTLLVADIDSTGKLSNNKQLLDGWAEASGLTWSPDSRWLAYSKDDLDFNAEVYIQPIDGSREPTNISLHPRGDGNPVWSKDGKKLGFVSNRNNGDDDVWFVWLRKEDWEKTKSEWTDLEKDGEPEPKKEAKDDDEEEGEDEEDAGPEPIEIDFEDIHERLVQVTRLAGDENRLQVSHDGETFYFVTNGGGWTGSGGKPALMKVKWDGSDMESVLGNASGAGKIRLDKDGKNLYMLKSGGLAHVSTDGGSPTSLPFSARMNVNYREERSQIFEEAWRALNLSFYDPNFHGQDWTALRKRYRPRALAASTDIDFRVMVNEMLGQLNASHMGIYGGSRAETSRAQTGRIGVEVKPNKHGLEILSIVPGSPASRKESMLAVGETILAVNDEPALEDNLYKLLEGTTGLRTLISVRAKNGDERDVIIRPVRSLRTELYESWVKERKRLTEKYSGGKLGYIHVQAMGWSSFERFERELTAAGLGKDGILIDVRYNGGGWTTDMLMTVLNVRQHAYTVPRGATNSLEKNNQDFKKHYPYGERLPLSAWTKPSAALCNEYSYSNAEIFSHAFKTLGHGPLIGMPTFGAVISTGGQSLMNDYYVRMPFRAWYVLATGENMENGPAVPTHVVPEAPSVKGSGEDPQLQKAVDVLLDGMD